MYFVKWSFCILQKHCTHCYKTNLHIYLFILWHTKQICIYPLSLYIWHFQFTGHLAQLFNFITDGGLWATWALSLYEYDVQDGDCQHEDVCDDQSPYRYDYGAQDRHRADWAVSIFDCDDCQQDDVGDDHYSAQDDDVGDDQRCWGMQVGGQKQTPATPLWQFWQARLSVVCSQCWPAALSVWASWILPPPIWALGLSQKRWESSVICVRTLFYLSASWTITWVNNTKSHVS